MTTTDAAGGAEDAIPAGNWQPAVLMVNTTNTSGPITGGSHFGGSVTATPIIQGSPTVITGTSFGIGQWAPITGFDPPEVEDEPDECKDGHYIDSKSIRVV